MSQTVEQARMKCSGCGTIVDVVIALPGAVLENDMVTCRECGGELGWRDAIRAERLAALAEDDGCGPSISVKPDFREE